MAERTFESVRQSPEEELSSGDAVQADLIFADCPNGWRPLTYVQYPGKSDRIQVKKGVTFAVEFEILTRIELCSIFRYI